MLQARGTPEFPSAVVHATGSRLAQAARFSGSGEPGIFPVKGKLGGSGGHQSRPFSFYWATCMAIRRCVPYRHMPSQPTSAKTVMDRGFLPLPRRGLACDQVLRTCLIGLTFVFPLSQDSTHSHKRGPKLPLQPSQTFLRVPISCKPYPR